jgi:hypothetical protein
MKPWLGILIALVGLALALISLGCAVHVIWARILTGESPIDPAGLGLVTAAGAIAAGWLALRVNGERLW